MKVEGGKETFQLQSALRGPVSVLSERASGRLRRRAPASLLQLYWRFLVAGLTRHGQTGAVVPSQRFLIRRMLEPVPPEFEGRIIELGAGTGALTLRLAARCPAASILACEINPALAAGVEARLVAAGLNGRVKMISDSAEQLLTGIQGNRLAPRPQFIISGIPLGNLGRERAVALIECIHTTLRPGGMYIQFQHSLLDRKKIRVRFARLRTLPVWLNVPPAVVYYAWK